MKRITPAIVLVTMLVFGMVSFGQRVHLSKADSLSIVKSVRDFEEAFNKHDAHAFANLFLPDGEFTNVVGASAKGRKEIEAFHAPVYEGKPGYPSFKNSVQKNDAPKISAIKPDVASVDFIWHLDTVTLPDGTEVKNRRGLITWLMVKENGKWGIAIMHNAELPSENK